MKNKAWIYALLGVVIGVLLTVSATLLMNSKETKASYNNWRKLNLILERVQKHYVDTVDVQKVTDAAVVAALSALDPHSVYLPPVDLQKAETELAGNFDGIGIQFNVPNDTAIVLEVIPGGPSEKVGLQVGDRILQVGETPIAGVKFPQDSMVRRMKGPAGTKVAIVVGREGERISFDITRGKIPVHSIDAAFMLNDTTGYIRLSKFSKTTFKEFAAASSLLLSQGMSRLLFDLRDNTGGYFDQALMLSDLFLEKDDLIVFLQGLNRSREEYKADGKGILKDIAISVLINESSASSSEIFAGAIQDNDRGVVVGRRSFGKGMVQEPLFFTDGSGVRITVARFHTPSGRCIQKPYNGEDYAYDIYKRYEHGEMFHSDSVQVDSSAVFKTKGGRTVYGGGGIIPDIYVPMDTTLATKFFVQCNRKAAQMRFASSIFDEYKGRLTGIDDYKQLEAFLDGLNLKSRFLSFTAKEGIKIQPGEWEQTESYLLPQLRALIGRYSKLGDNAFYKLYLPVDDIVNIALESESVVRTTEQ